MQPKTILALSSVVLAAALAAVGVDANAGPWAELHDKPKLEQVSIQRAGNGQCALEATFTAAAKPTAKIEGAPDARWAEVYRVPCAAVATLLQSAEVVRDCQRPAAWPQNRPPAADKRACK